ncbi:MAG: ABC-F family ATP-binding cassette domain-containing protein [Bacteroidota bacterium]
MLILHDVSYIHPNRELLFTRINLNINKHEKIALVGNNGTGKSTLLKLLADVLQPSAGVAKADSTPYYVPQIFGQFNAYTVAQALQIEDKLKSLDEITNGNATDENFATLGDDWTIDQRCREAFAHWQLEDVSLSQKLDTLSGGQKTKVFLAGIQIHRPEIVLLDEPSNQLDAASRSILYDYIQSTNNTLVVVSHDRTLLNILNTVYELSKRGITIYGGNFDFYAEQKAIEADTLNNDFKSKEKALRKAKETEKESAERQQKLDARGRKNQQKAGLPAIVINTLRNKAENSTSRMKGVHAEKVAAIAQELSRLRTALPGIDKMKMDFDDAAIHKGKVLITAVEINFSYDGTKLWKQGLNFQIRSGERLVVKGRNGSGKTTLIKILFGEFKPGSGIIETADFKAIYINQDYSLIDNNLTVYEQAQHFNSGALQEHDVKIRLNRFLFTKEYWDKSSNALSGGEKMRLILCCLTISNQAPDMMILDEPTNNLDIQNIEILTNAVMEYRGTLIVVSHDDYFLKEIGIERAIELE